MLIWWFCSESPKSYQQYHYNKIDLNRKQPYQRLQCILRTDAVIRLTKEMDTMKCSKKLSIEHRMSRYARQLMCLRFCLVQMVISNWKFEIKWYGTRKIEIATIKGGLMTNKGTIARNQNMEIKHIVTDLNAVINWWQWSVVVNLMQNIDNNKILKGLFNCCMPLYISTHWQIFEFQTVLQHPYIYILKYQIWELLNYQQQNRQIWYIYPCCWKIS